GSDAWLVMAGDSAQYVAGVSEPGILRLGRITDESKRDLFAAATLVAMPSRVESLGLAYLEAWANALPVIGARAGATSELILDGENGLLVPYADSAALGRAIETLLKDRDVRRRLGDSGHTLVQQRFTWQRVLPRIRSVYD